MTNYSGELNGVLFPLTHLSHFVKHWERMILADLGISCSCSRRINLCIFSLEILSAFRKFILIIYFEHANQRFTGIFEPYALFGKILRGSTLRPWRITRNILRRFRLYMDSSFFQASYVNFNSN